MENDKINGKWVTLKNGRHVFIKEGQTLAGALKESDRQKTEDLKRIYDSDFGGTDGHKVVWLEKKEYAEVCSAIRTKFTDNIPAKGSVFYRNHYYLFKYDNNACQIVYYKKIPIVGNEDFINKLEARINDRRRKKNS